MESNTSKVHLVTTRFPSLSGAPEKPLHLRQAGSWTGNPCPEGQRCAYYTHSTIVLQYRRYTALGIRTAMRESALNTLPTSTTGLPPRPSSSDGWPVLSSLFRF